MVEPGYDIVSADVIATKIGARKISTSFLELSKFQLYLAFQILFAGSILLYQSLWIFSKPAVAYCYVYTNRPHAVQNSGTLVYQYVLGDKSYTETTTRNEFPVGQNMVDIRYLSFAPSVSRIDSFYHNWLGFLIAYGMFFLGTTIIFFIPNDTMPRNSYFYFTSKRPFIHMIIK